jgi:alpha-L-arabinofuranosidase
MLGRVTEQFGKTACLFAVNETDESRRRRVDARGSAAIGGRADVAIIAGSSLLDVNGFAHPDTVRPVSSTFDVGERFDYEFPPLSVTRIEWRTE